MGDHVRVESAICATASGNLTYEKWPYEVSMALGLAGQRNPLGFAVVRYLSGTPSSAEVWNIVLVLATQLLKAGNIDQEAARESAWRGFEWWKDARCSRCSGRGITDAEQRTCPDCHGIGKRAMPQSPVAVREAIGHLIEAESFMEGQLAKRLARWG